MLATELFEKEVEPQWYCTMIIWEGDEMFISFLLAPSCEEQEQVENNVVKVEENPDLPKKDISSGTSKVWREAWPGKAYNFEKE